MGYEIETPGAAFGVPDTPIQWLQYLLAKYEGNLDRIKRFAEYYEGDHQRMMFAQAKFSNAFGEAFSSWSDNFCGLIVDSVNERMKIEGFRMADTLRLTTPHRRSGNATSSTPTPTRPTSMR